MKLSGCNEIIVVLGFKSDEIIQEINNEDVKIVENHDYSYGRASSIKTAVNKSLNLILSSLK